MPVLDHVPWRWSGLLSLAISVACGERGPPATPALSSNDTAATEAKGPAASPDGAGRPLAEWSAWALADTGFGPIRIGMTPAQANAAVGGALALPPAGPDDGCGYAFPRGVDGLGFMIAEGRVVRIDVRRHDFRTVEGAGIGDSEERIHQLYPGRVRTSPHKYAVGHYLTVVPSDTVAHPYRLIFETDGAIVKSFRGGVLPQVAYVEGCS